MLGLRRIEWRDRRDAAPGNRPWSNPGPVLGLSVESHDAEELATATSGAKSRHSPGSCLRTWLPRSVNEMPDPVTSSLTVLDTRTSPGCATAAIRTPVNTVMPLMVV